MNPTPALAVIYERQGTTDRAIRWIEVPFPFPGELNVTRHRRRISPKIRARFWGVRTDVAPPVVAYRVVVEEATP